MIPDHASTLLHLEGSLSGATYAADQLIGADPVDERPLLARYDTRRAGATLSPSSLAERTGLGLWRWWELLPVGDPDHVVTLGEGGTPVLQAPALGRGLGAKRLRVKAEGLNPTGSFKARGMAVAVSRASELGARSLIVPSAGNAAGALAAYGARAGLDVTVLMPFDSPRANIEEALVCSARVLLVDGLISDCGALARALAPLFGAFDVSTLKEPYRLEGKKTMGFELAADLGWTLPDVIVYPTGGGTGLIGMWKAFDELEEVGLLGPERPRMVSVQAAGCAPIVRAFHDGERFARPWEGARTRASGLRVPGAVGDFLILDALRASGGTAVAVEEDQIDDAQRLAGRLGAGYVSPETAAALAAVGELASSGWLAGDERVVVFDTGIGHKYPAPALPSVPTVPADADPEQVLAALARR
ncbi:MAG: threonine synthase [Egibacteraceae bacterium]